MLRFMLATLQGRTGRLHFALAILLACAFHPNHLLAADTAAPTTTAQIPLLDSPLRLADFTEMKPPAQLAARLGHIDHFTQQVPANGKDASERTEVWFGYTRTALYMAFVCYDSHPGGVRAHLARREQILTDDYVQVIFDPFKDRRRGFLFAVNPLGVQADALFTDSTNSDPDYSYDQVWNSAGKLTPQGWVALMEIPFKSLRFRAGQTDWGIVISRNLPRRSEIDYWPVVSSTVSGTLTQEGAWTGFEGITPSHNLQVNPYSLLHGIHLLDTRDPLQPYFRNREAQGTAGGDFKAVLRDSLVLDATYNPDFSQLESDEPQLTVNQRFEVYYPERRPFFLENSNYFITPLQFVFTRRIRNPEYGARLTGKVGRENVGLLVTDDRGPGDTVPDHDPDFHKRAHFYIARLSHDVGKESSVGLLYTGREFQSSFNRIGGVDAKLRLTPAVFTEGQFALSSTRLLDGSYHAGPASTIRLQRDGRQFNSRLFYNDYSTGFLSQVGFFRRTNLRNFGTRTGYRWRPEGKHLLDFGPQFYGESGFDHAGNRQFFYSELDWIFDLTRNTTIAPLFGVNSDTLLPRDFPGLQHSQNYTQNYGGITIISQPMPALAITLNATHGGSPNYNPQARGFPSVSNEDFVQGIFTFQPTRAFTWTNTYLLDRNLSRKNGRLVYDSQTIRSRLNYQFTQALSLRAIVQYDPVAVNPEWSSLPRTKHLGTELLFTWLPHPGTAVYVGYNSDLQNLDRGLCHRLASGACDPGFVDIPRANQYLNDGRELFVKVSYLFRF